MEKPAPFRQRLFLALDLPPSARGHIVAWQAEMLGHYARELRFVAPEALHVTVVFLGNVAHDPLGHIRTYSLGAATRDPPDLEAVGIRALPPRRPRLWALSLADHGGRAAALHEKISLRLAGQGLYIPDGRAFWPHVTVARIRPDVRAPSVEVPPPPIRFKARTFSLYRSHRGPAGAEYELMGRVSLDESPP